MLLLTGQTRRSTKRYSWISSPHKSKPCPSSLTSLKSTRYVRCELKKIKWITENVKECFDFEDSVKNCFESIQNNSSIKPSFMVMIQVYSMILVISDKYYNNTKITVPFLAFTNLRTNLLLNSAASFDTSSTVIGQPTPV